MDDMEMWWSLIAFLIAVALVGCPNGADAPPTHTDAPSQHITQ